MPTSYDPFAPHSDEPAKVEEVQAVEPKEEPVPQGTSIEILEWVGNDKSRAERAIKAEEDSDRPRKGLTADLRDLLGA